MLADGVSPMELWLQLLGRWHFSVEGNFLSLPDSYDFEPFSMKFQTAKNTFVTISKLFLGELTAPHRALHLCYNIFQLLSRILICVRRRFSLLPCQAFHFCQEITASGLTLHFILPKITDKHQVLHLFFR